MPPSDTSHDPLLGRLLEAVTAEERGRPTAAAHGVDHQVSRDDRLVSAWARHACSRHSAAVGSCEVCDDMAVEDRHVGKLADPPPDV
jgi:hypothetical protein